MSARFEIISGMVLSEKSNLLSGLGKYTFRVCVSANKPEIKKAIEAFFGKRVLSVNVSNFRGKVRRKRTASEGSTACWKKAVVTLAAGERIELA